MQIQSLKKAFEKHCFFSQLHFICQRKNGVPNISKSQSYLQMIDFTVKFISILPIDGAVISLLDVVVLKKKCGWVGKATENGGVNKQFYPPLVSSLWQHCNYAIPNRHLKQPIFSCTGLQITFVHFCSLPIALTLHILLRSRVTQTQNLCQWSYYPAFVMLSVYNEYYL